MRGSVVALAASSGAGVVVNIQRTPLSDDANAEAVDETNAAHVGSGVGVVERGHAVGDVVSGECEGGRHDVGRSWQ